SLAPGGTIPAESPWSSRSKREFPVLSSEPAIHLAVLCQEPRCRVRSRHLQSWVGCNEEVGYSSRQNHSPEVGRWLRSLRKGCTNFQSSGRLVESHALGYVRGL